MSKIHHPAIKELGLDLLVMPRWKVYWTILEPIIFFILYIIFAYYGKIIPAILSVIVMSYFTYGSTSHDLVHRNLKLNRTINDILLSFIEMISIRSGTAYRIAHLNHHKKYPHDDDVEGKAASMSLFGSLLEGLFFQHRIVRWALKNGSNKERRMIIYELTFIAFILLGGILLIPISIFPILYILLSIMGSWIIPFATSYLVHTPEGTNELLQTKLFRGKFYSIISLEHLYHLEHHLYPMVPHKNWKELARRLDPYFEKMNIKPNRIP